MPAYTRMSDAHAEENKTTARRYYDEVLNQGEVDALDGLVDSNYVEHGPLPGQGAGRAGLAQRVHILRQAFPDIHFTVDDMVAEADKVIVCWTMRGTHHGEFTGVPATGRTAKATGIDVIRMVDGKIAEHWHEFDALGLLQQLGVIPTPEQPPR